MALDDPDDGALLRAHGAGDPHAFARLYDRYDRPCFLFIRRLLGVDGDHPLISRDQVRHAKPDPDLFLAAAVALGVEIEDCVVVGDSIWDILAARRARALGVGLLSGGYGEDELQVSGAFRVYADPADLLEHLDEIGVRAAHTHAPA